jgi:hypothetical protein
MIAVVKYMRLYGATFVGVLHLAQEKTACATACKLAISATIEAFGVLFQH